MRGSASPHYSLVYTSYKTYETFCYVGDYLEKLAIYELPDEHFRTNENVYDEIVYIYVTVIKDNTIKDTLKYADGYIDVDYVLKMM